MWLRFVERLRCPLCRAKLQVFPFEETNVRIAEEYIEAGRALGLGMRDLARKVNAGLLACDSCKRSFPISQGVPVLLPYTTQHHREFSRKFQSEISKLPFRYEYPAMEPVPGERFVLTSFSNEWQQYDYDGVIWEMTYQDHEKRFLTEMAFPSDLKTPLGFLEVGCGLGITTSLAYARYKFDCVGVDLSQAAFRAAHQFRDNPFLHFVQASTFYMPFSDRGFDLVYSRGVLHHTYSTRDAFNILATFCKPGGGLYLWIYGPGSKNETVFRKVAFALETLTRPLVSLNPDSWPSRAFLSSMALGYTAYNRLRRMSNPAIQKLNLRRAIHAARDRFTPRFAHRHDQSEVVGWFQQAGFKSIEVVDWKSMPAADWDDYRRNVGVRGVCAVGSKA